MIDIPAGALLTNEGDVRDGRGELRTCGDTVRGVGTRSKRFDPAPQAITHVPSKLLLDFFLSTLPTP